MSTFQMRRHALAAPLAVVELNRASLRSALAALREGRSTGNAMLDHMAGALGRCQARAWAHFRSACPDLSEAEIDVAADVAVDVLASVPVFVVMVAITDAAAYAAAGGPS